MNVSEGPIASRAAQVYEFGEFRVDVAKRAACRRNGDRLALAPKVYDTLLYLVEHSGDVVDKDRLMQAIWPDAVVEENNLNQHISTLRRVLGETPGSRRYIVTVPGRGYQFVAEVACREITRSSPESPVRSIAVLPFKPLVLKARDISLEIGMADTLIARLSTIRGIIVRPLSAVRRYVEVDEEPLQAGRDLGVESVLDGSIHKSGGKVRVNARLLSIATGESLWAGTFDEKFTDIFGVQDAIAERVLSALSMRLSAQERQSLTKRETENAEAYQLYLKGRYYWWKTTPEEFRKCRDYFQRAVDADPSYALAYCGLNAFYGFGSAFGLLPPEEGWPRAAKANQKALELDDHLPQAHSDLGAYRMVAERDWNGAEAAIREAIAHNPQVEEVHYLYSFFLLTRARFDEAIAEAQLALRLDPLSLRIHQHLGTAFYHARRYDEAIERFQKTLELDQDNALVRQALGDALARKQLHKEALREWRQAFALLDDKQSCRIIDDSAGARDFGKVVRRLAQQRLERLRQRRNAGDYIAEIEFVRGYLDANEKERAMAALDKACAERNVFALLLNTDPLYDVLRKGRDFAAILKRHGLEPAADVPAREGKLRRAGAIQPVRI